MEELILLNEEENKRKGTVMSVVLHLLLLLLCLLPMMSHQDPAPEQQSVLVAFGFPEENAQNVKVSRAPVEVKESNKAKVEEKRTTKKTSESPNTSKAPSKTTTLDDPEVKIISKGEIQRKEKLIETQNLKEAQEKKAENEVLKKAQAEAEAKRKAEAEAKRKAEEEAQAKAEREKKQALEAKKSEFGDLLKKGTGNDTKPTGSEKGDPNSSALDGMITGDGKIGGGLSGRSMLYEPTLQDNSQKTGTVVVRVCVNQVGKVIEAKFTQKGSSTTDNYLVNLAESHAKKYKFSPGELEKQCGTLTLEFKLK